MPIRSRSSVWMECGRYEYIFVTCIVGFGEIPFDEKMIVCYF